MRQFRRWAIFRMTCADGLPTRRLGLFAMPTSPAAWSPYGSLNLSPSNDRQDIDTAHSSFIQATKALSLEELPESPPLMKKAAGRSNFIQQSEKQVFERLCWRP
jgi:hypothetical protein